MLNTFICLGLGFMLGMCIMALFKNNNADDKDDFTDEELKAELKSRGYVIYKKKPKK